MCYKKTYSLFIVWVLFFFMILFGAVTMLQSVSIFPQIKLLIVFNVVNLLVALLCFLIYKTQYVYWISGISYDEANKASSSSRKLFAKAYLISFSKVLGIYFLYSLLAVGLRIHTLISVLFYMILLIMFSVKIIKIKLN